VEGFSTRWLFFMFPKALLLKGSFYLPESYELLFHVIHSYEKIIYVIYLDYLVYQHISFLKGSRKGEVFFLSDDLEKFYDLQK